MAHPSTDKNSSKDADLLNNDDILAHLHPNWTPLVTEDTPERTLDSLVTPSWEHLQVAHRADSLPSSPRSFPLAETTSSEDFPDNDQFPGPPPPIFIPMRFRLPDLPLKLRHPQQVELDDGPGVYLPKTLLDEDFKRQLEEELFRTLPSYAEMDRYFGTSSRAIPPLTKEEQLIVRKRYSKLCIQYKSKLQDLRRELLNKWEAALSTQPDVSHSMIELAAFRRSRPDWRGYLLFVHTFNHRYDFLPKLLLPPLRNPVPFQTPDKLLAIIRELTTVRNNPSKYKRVYPDSLFAEYRMIRRKRQVAAKKAAFEQREAALAQKYGDKKLSKRSTKTRILPPEIKRNTLFSNTNSEHLTFKQKLKRAMLVLKELQRNPNKILKPAKEVVSEQEKWDKEAEERKLSRATRCRRRLMMFRESGRVALQNPFQVYPSGLRQLFMARKLSASNLAASSFDLRRKFTTASRKSRSKSSVPISDELSASLPHEQDESDEEVESSDDDILKDYQENCITTTCFDSSIQRNPAVSASEKIRTKVRYFSEVDAAPKQTTKNYRISKLLKLIDNPEIICDHEDRRSEISSKTTEVTSNTHPECTPRRHVWPHPRYYPTTEPFDEEMAIMKRNEARHARRSKSISIYGNSLYGSAATQPLQRHHAPSLLNVYRKSQMMSMDVEKSASTIDSGTPTATQNKHETTRKHRIRTARLPQFMRKWRDFSRIK